ncbi:MAG: hypothetical protein V3T44_04495, partial [bacterium]
GVFFIARPEDPLLGRGETNVRYFWDATLLCAEFVMSVLAFPIGGPERPLKPVVGHGFSLPVIPAKPVPEVFNRGRE